jgi:hypothetical protein
MNINNYKTAMRKIVTLIMLCTSLVLRAQNDVLVIYIDASESGDKLVQIKNEVEDLVASKSSARVYLFISHGESPLVTSDREDIGKLLRKLRSSRPSAPDYKRDTKLLNTALLKNNYISNINSISKNSGLDYQVDIHFWLDERNYNDFQLDKKIIDPLLFSNKLKFKNGLQENCNPILHLENETEIKTQRYE